VQCVHWCGGWFMHGSDASEHNPEGHPHLLVSPSDVIIGVQGRVPLVTLAQGLVLPYGCAVFDKDEEEGQGQAHRVAHQGKCSRGLHGLLGAARLYGGVGTHRVQVYIAQGKGHNKAKGHRVDNGELEGRGRICSHTAHRRQPKLQVLSTQGSATAEGDH
jgi:hypothetical protein